MSKLKERVQGRVRFHHYQDGNLIYMCEGDNFEFPVPVTDCGSARFEHIDKGILFMKWIKRQMNLIEVAQS